MLGQLAERLRGGLAVEPVRNTQLVLISYRSDKPDFAAKAAPTVSAEAFIDMGVESRFSNAGKASSFLGSQIEALKQEIDDKEKKLQAFSRRRDIVTLDPSANVTLQRLEALNASYIESKRAHPEGVQHREILTAPRETVADTLSEGVVSNLRADQLRLERDYETKLKTYKPDWPAMVGAQDPDREGAAAPRRGDRGDGEHRPEGRQRLLPDRPAAGAEPGVRAPKSSRARRWTRAPDAVEYTNLQTEIKTRRGLLDELLRSQSETEVTARLQDTRDSNVHIIDHALVPGGPFYPSLRKDATTGLLVGLLLSAALILVIESSTARSRPRKRWSGGSVFHPGGVPDLSESGRGYGYFAGYGGYGGYGYGAEEAAPRVRPGKKKRGGGAELAGKEEGSP